MITNLWHDVSPDRIKPDDFLAVIEIAKGMNKKYELDKATGALILDRILYTSTHYPQNYGFVPLTYSEDNDPLDVMVLCSESLDPGVLVRCYPIAAFTMIDNGELDEKVIAIPFSDPYYNHYRNSADVPKHLVEVMNNFYATYKILENKQTVVENFVGRHEAEKIVKRNIERYREKFITGMDGRQGNKVKPL